MSKIPRRLSARTIAVAAVATLGLFSLWAIDANRYAAEMAVSGRIAESLLDYARKHNGQFPPALLPQMDNGDTVNGLCVFFAGLEWSDGGHPMYLYFPGKTLSSHGSPEIVGASLVVCQNYGRSIRVVIFSDGKARWCDDRAFLRFLRGRGTAVPEARVIY